MATKQELKNAVCEAIDRNRERIIGLGERIRRQPELGFKEFKTARLAEETLSQLGLKPRGGLALTGVRAEAAGVKDGPTFALLGELDGLVVAGHPIADPETGAAHAGEGQPGPRGQAHALEGLRDELRRLELLEPELGMTADRLPQRDDLRPAAVDRRAHPLHHLRLRHVVISSLSGRP